MGLYLGWDKKGAAGRKKEGKEREREWKREMLPKYIVNDIITDKGRPIELWVYGGCCLGNRPIGHAVLIVAYVMSHVLILTILPKHKEYTFFSVPHGTFFKLDHKLGHKSQ